mmetsp:Transcript_16243/g.32941  ORF Transcript_16243/g.32941 Transcript_16243/m.32941 type:complete len:238 (-) Transcript_16243:845-1558(-)|eukprot:CAMPEP_0184682436 /NCGR_PEP_ID=MMETSP0312-20130426/7264_1 /TAXON_ID=31354 /ORGANISM="Compsopogon coeruleus, Strain SAG 36.94" /LENGTH=237 /DNA_ID=CAMNT_0027134115 /DNA_START=23 /DNA_END=739 /DNA_ORIENTATION=+
MSAWDDEGFEAHAVVDTTVKASWEDEDAEVDEGEGGVANEEKGPEKPDPASMNKPKRQKEIRMDKMRERERMEAEKEAERLRRQEEEMADMTEVERKLARQRLVEEQDFENSKDLFMSGAAAGDEDVNSIRTLDGFKPVTDAEFKRFGFLVAQRLKELYHPKFSFRYVELLKSILKDAVADLSPEEVKELSTLANVVMNEKLKSKAGLKKGKKSTAVKKSVKVDRDDVYANEYDDFM